MAERNKPTLRSRWYDLMHNRVPTFLRAIGLVVGSLGAWYLIGRGFQLVTEGLVGNTVRLDLIDRWYILIGLLLIAALVTWIVFWPTRLEGPMPEVSNLTAKDKWYEFMHYSVPFFVRAIGLVAGSLGAWYLIGRGCQLVTGRLLKLDDGIPSSFEDHWHVLIGLLLVAVWVAWKAFLPTRPAGYYDRKYPTKVHQETKAPAKKG